MAWHFRDSTLDWRSIGEGGEMPEFLRKMLGALLLLGSTGYVCFLALF